MSIKIVKLLHACLLATPLIKLSNVLQLLHSYISDLNVVVSNKE